MMSVSAASQNLEIVQKNPDGSVRIKIDGVTYLAITGKQVDDWQIAQNNLATAKADLKDKDVQIKEALLQRDLAEAQKALIQQKADSFEADSKRHEADAARNYNLFIGERTLRQEASQFIPKGNSHGFWGKTLDLLNSEAGQVGFKLVIPAATFLRTYNARCMP